jgi:hypothetical protein
MSLTVSTWMAASPSPSPSHVVPVMHHIPAAGGTPTSIIWATWITALATTGLLAGAYFTARYAAKTFREQADQVALLRQQAKRDIQERRRAQAAQVFVLITSGVPAAPGVGVQVAAECRNTSGQPVYDITVEWRTNTGPFGKVTVEPELMPGETTPFTEPWTEAQGSPGLSVKIAFRDAAGIHWRTNDRGELTELCGHTTTFRDRCVYEPGHDGPHSWAQERAPTEPKAPTEST